MTVPALKQLCRDCDVKGYSKLAKEALIAAILEKQGQAPSLEQNLARSTSKSVPDPATEQFLQRTSVKVVFSRDESEARIEKNKGLVVKRAEVSGVTAKNAIDSEAGAQLVKATTGKSLPSHQTTGITSPAPFTSVGSKGSLASTFSAAREASVTPAPASLAPVPAKQEKLVVKASQIQKVGAPGSPASLAPNPSAARETQVRPPPARPTPVPAKKDKHVAQVDQIQEAGAPEKPRKKRDSEMKAKPVAVSPETATRSAVKKSTKMVVSTQQIQKAPPAVPREPQEKRFQELPVEDQRRAIKSVSKNVQSLLKLRKPDLMKKKAKDLEKYLELLEVEKGRFTVYRPTEKALRGLMDESIALINQVKEEQLNQLEQQYITNELPKIIKKNEDKIKKLIARIDRYYTDMDAARDIVEKFVKKPPFPPSYLMTVIAQKIRDKAL